MTEEFSLKTSISVYQIATLTYGSSKIEKKVFANSRLCQVPNLLTLSP